MHCFYFNKICSMYYSSNMFHALGIKILEQKEKYLKAQMTVNNNNCQPLGFLCGGASIAMAEILAGMGSMALLDDKHFPLGTSVSANHLRAAAFGTTVYAHAKAMHVGKTLHLWDIQILDADDKIISVVRVNNQIVNKRS